MLLVQLCLPHHGTRLGAILWLHGTLPGLAQHLASLLKAVGAGGGPGPDRLDRLILIGFYKFLYVFTGLEPGGPKPDREFA